MHRNPKVQHKYKIWQGEERDETCIHMVVYESVKTSHLTLGTIEPYLVGSLALYHKTS